MEQKQLDELDHSYSEEFIEEPVVEEVKIEPLRPKREIKKEAVKEVLKKEIKVEKSKILPKVLPRVPETPKVEVKKTEIKKPEVKVFKKEFKKEEPKKKEKPKIEINKNISKARLEEQKNKEETKIEIKTEAKADFKGTVKADLTPRIEVVEESEEDSSIFWQVLTVVAVILLVVSLFTQGFNFGDSTLTLAEAQQETLTYVNTKLLQPPYQAEVTNAADAGDLYRITLAVAGEEIDSYITKDGKLLFPQGFEVVTEEPEITLEPEVVLEPETETISEITGPVIEPTAAELAEPATEAITEQIPKTETLPETTPAAEVSPVENNTKPQINETPVVEPLGPSTLQAKRWYFNPQKLTVKRGEVEITIKPENMAFTFAIPQLGIREEVTGEKTIKFNTNRTGSFEFNCASCEAWRGMVGTLVIE